MRKVNGENIYHYQKNDGIVEIMQDYIFRELKKMTKEKEGVARDTLIELRNRITLHNSCFPASFCDGAESCGWPMDVFTPGIQASDAVMCIINNPHNAKLFHKASRYVPQTWGYNEIPDYYPKLAEIIWGDPNMCRYTRRITYDDYCGYIDNECCVVYAHPGHMVVGKGYDITDGKKSIVYNDPYRKKNMTESAKTIGICVIIFPYNK
jgi:hypothetical protein